MFENYQLRIYAFRRNVKFITNVEQGTTSAFGCMAWFVGNVGAKEDFIAVKYIDNEDIHNENHVNDDDIM